MEDSKIKTTTHSNETWYCARDVVESLGLAWANKSQSLREVLEHDKAILRFTTEGGDQNIWCVSENGLETLKREYYPLTPDRPSSTKGKGVIFTEDPKTGESLLNYKVALKRARQNPTPFLIMLLIDEVGFNIDVRRLANQQSMQEQAQIADYAQCNEKAA